MFRLSFLSPQKRKIQDLLNVQFRVDFLFSSILWKTLFSCSLTFFSGWHPGFQCCLPKWKVAWIEQIFNLLLLNKYFTKLLRGTYIIGSLIIYTMTSFHCNYLAFLKHTMGSAGGIRKEKPEQGWKKLWYTVSLRFLKILRFQI